MHYVTAMQRLSSVRRLYATAAATAQNPFPFPTASHPKPHEIFHLPRNASPEDIKARCKRTLAVFVSSFNDDDYTDYELVRIYHPDRSRILEGIEPEIAHSRFQAIAAAYNTLQKGNSWSSNSSSSNSEDAGKPTTDAAAWRAMHIYRRRKLYEGGDEQWKDRLIIAGVGGTLLIFVAQMYWTRQLAAEEMASLPRQQHSDSKPIVYTATKRPRPEDDRLSQDT